MQIFFSVSSVFWLAFFVSFFFISVRNFWLARWQKVLVESLYYDKLSKIAALARWKRRVTHFPREPPVSDSVWHLSSVRPHPLFRKALRRNSGSNTNTQSGSSSIPLRSIRNCVVWSVISLLLFLSLSFPPSLTPVSACARAKCVSSENVSLSGMTVASISGSSNNT